MTIYSLKGIAKTWYEIVIKMQEKLFRKKSKYLNGRIRERWQELMVQRDINETTKKGIGSKGERSKRGILWQDIGRI